MLSVKREWSQVTCFRCSLVETIDQHHLRKQISQTCVYILWDDARKVRKFVCWFSTWKFALFRFIANWNSLNQRNFENQLSLHACDAAAQAEISSEFSMIKYIFGMYAIDNRKFHNVDAVMECDSNSIQFNWGNSKHSEEEAILKLFNI